MIGIAEVSKTAQAVTILTYIPGVPNSNVVQTHTIFSKVWTKFLASFNKLQIQEAWNFFCT